MDRATLIVFAKMPRAGHAKTRLGCDIGMARATQLFRLMTMSTLDAAMQAKAQYSGLRVVLAVDSPAAMGQTCLAWNYPVRRIAQVRGDLGTRMKQAMKEASLQGVAGPVIITGTDTPQLSARHILEACHRLKTHDAVFGPALDGGYWLAGFKNYSSAPDLFDGVRWSTDKTLADTVNSLPASYNISNLERLCDIDTQEDLQALGQSVFLKSSYR